MPRRGLSGADVEQIASTLLEALDNAGVGASITAEVESRLERVYLNQTAADLVGIPLEEAYETPPMQHLPEKERERIQRMRESWTRGEESPRSFEIEIATVDGRRVPVEIGLARANYGSDKATVAFLRDLSERRRMEGALRSSEARFRSIAELSPDSITMISEGRLVYANPATLDMFGYSYDEMVGKPLKDLIIEDEHPVLRERGMRIFSGETLAPTEYSLRRKDGSIIKLEIASTLIEHEGKAGLLSFGRDLSERKQHQAELMQADRLSTVGTLVTAVAHEVNNPLTYVMLQLSRIKQRLPSLVADPDEARACEAMIAEALEGSERVGRIVRELLSFAHPGDRSLGPVSLEKVLDCSIRLASSIIRHSANIEYEGVEHRFVLGEEARLSQVFLNLLVNAGQAFRDPNDKANRVRVTLEERGECTIVKVEDNGPGIPEDQLARVFEPFFTTKPPGSGTGLGLAISRKIIESLGGEIFMSSRLGAGTSVTVTLVRADPP